MFVPICFLSRLNNFGKFFLVEQENLWNLYLFPVLIILGTVVVCYLCACTFAFVRGSLIFFSFFPCKSELFSDADWLCSIAVVHLLSIYRVLG